MSEKMYYLKMIIDILRGLDGEKCKKIFYIIEGFIYN